jgi:hypothetical protein
LKKLKDIQPPTFLPSRLNRLSVNDPTELD